MDTNPQDRRSHAEEAAVHSLEHGAVWLAYEPGAPPGVYDALRARTVNEPYLLVSPVEDLPTPVAAAAWGRLLPLEGPDDPRLDAFLRAHLQGPQTPEPGAPCTGGISATAP